MSPTSSCVAAHTLCQGKGKEEEEAAHTESISYNAVRDVGYAGENVTEVCARSQHTNVVCMNCVAGAVLLWC